MADIESNIKVNIDTSDALSQLKLLQQQISAFQQAMKNAGAQNAAAAQAMQQNLMSSINATGKFTANIQTIKTSAESFTESLERNKLSIGQYFKYAGGASKTFGKLFKTEFDTIQQVAVDRVKTIQTQYIKLGRDASGAMKAIAVRPLALDMDNLGTKTQIAAQKQQLFNQLMKQGSTQLLNFGKNTQWAGRQLMVGFTIPLTLMGQAAAQAYMKIEAASLKFRRVYGDMNTTTEEANKMVKSVQALANEFTKYGIAVADTMDMAASAAAMGKTGADLMQQVAQASKLAVLGQVEQQQALETTISLTNAFGVSTEELAKSVDFLNAVENQTVVSIEDLTIAIPKAAPVIKQLGGDVEDLTFFLTAMKEGGINASEGANALKSGLASMINPTKKASDFLAKFGVNIQGIVEGNKGDIKGTVVDFAKALDTLDPLNRARAIEQMFGKFQFSRLSTLFKNVIDEGSQAATVAGLSRQTAEELAILSEREMNKISDSPMFKFQKSIEDMQAKLAPVGEAFLKAVTPIIEFVTKILDGFNNLSEGTKSFVSMLVLAVAGIGPVLLMTFGLIANGVANIMKLFTNMKAFINKTTRPSDILGEQTSYMNSEQLKSAAIAASLDQSHSKLRQTFTSEAAAVQQLTDAYRNAVQAQQAYSGIPGIPTGGNSAAPRKYAGGVSMVPGPAGAGDIVPALLSPGEAVIPARSAKKYAPVIRGMISGNLPGFEDGTPGAGMRQSIIGPMTQKQTEGIARTGKTLKDISDEVVAGPYGQVPVTNYGKQVSPSPGHSFPAFGVAGIYEKPDGSKVFVKPQMDLVSAMAEIRGTTIARDAHGLVAPNQALRVMMDPTDPENKRKFLVLESALDDKISNIPTSFTKDQYFKQLVASLLRGDKDLGIGNLGGDVLADVGPAGVFQRASGKRQLGSKINSMEEQAIINLLGVKGGAKRFFAESTSDIAKSMTPAEYDAAMKAEIQRVAPRLQATIAGFGNLSPEEKQAYMAMQQRLQSGMGVDWAKYQVMHSAVPPKKYNQGGFVGVDSEKTETFSQSLMAMSSEQIKNSLRIQDTHLVEAIDLTKNPQVMTQIRDVLPGVTREQLRGFEPVSNLTAQFPGNMNQRMKGEGYPPGMFASVWNGFIGKLSKSATIAGIELPSSQMIENEIGQAIANRGKNINDPEMGKIIEEVLGESAKIDDLTETRRNLYSLALKTAELRSKPKQLSQSGNDTIHSIVLRMLRSGDASFNENGTSITRPLGTRNIARFGTWEFEGIGTGKNPTIEQEEIRRRAQEAAYGPTGWATVGNFMAEMPTVNRKLIKPQDWDTVTNPANWNKMSPEERRNYLSSIPGTDPTTLNFRKQDYGQGFGNNKGPTSEWSYTASGLKSGIKWNPSQSNMQLAYNEMARNEIIPAEGKSFFDKLALGKKVEQMAKGGIIPGYANGVFSVPGPKGAGDVVPAMLSPGEAVIPAKQAAKHRPMIKQMIAGNLPGYANGGIIPGYQFGTDSVPFGVPVKVIIVGDETAPGLPLIQQQAAEAQIDATAETMLTDKQQRDLIKEQQALAKLQARKEQAQQLKIKAGYDEMSPEQQAKFDADLQKKYNKEDKKPSILSKAFQRTEATGKAQMGLYGVTSALGVASTMGGGIGQAAQAAMAPVGAAATAMSMIPGPAGMVVAGLAAIATVAVMVRDHLDKVRAESYRLTKAMGSGNDAINKFAVFAKTVSATETMNKRRELSSTGLFNIVQGKKTFGESYMESDSGKQLIKDVSTSISQGGLGQAQELITTQLSTAIASGVMTPAQARSVAANLGIQLQNADFGIRINAKLTDIFGPNGENLKKDPLEVRLRVVDEGKKAFKSVVNSDITNSAKVAQLAQKQASDAMGIFGSKNNPIASFFNVAGVTGIVENTITIFKYYENIDKAGASIAGNLASQLELQQQMVDSLDLSYEKRIAELDVVKDKDEIERLAQQREEDRTALLQKNKATTVSMYKDLSNLGGDALSAAKTASENAVDTAFKDSGREVEASMAKQSVKDLGAGATDQQKILLNTFLAAKQIDPQQMKAVTELGSTEEGNVTMRKLLFQGGTNIGKALGFAEKLQGQQKSEFLVRIADADPEESERTLANLEHFNKTTGIFDDVNDKKVIEAMINFAVENPDVMEDIRSDFDSLNTEKEITLNVVEKIAGKEVADTIISGKWLSKFNKMTKANKAIFVTEMQSLMSMKGNPAMQKAFDVWLTKNPGKKWDEYVTYEADRIVSIGVDFELSPDANTDPDPEEDAGPDASWLDQYVKNVRDAAKGSQALTVGISASGAALKTFGKSSNELFGLFTQLKKAGASSNIIESALGGDEETTKALIDTKTGKLKAGAQQIFDGINKVVAAQKKIDWLRLDAYEKMGKQNEMFNANLDVIKITEDKINKKYDTRIKALDEINSLNQRNAQQQQSAFSIASALARGDIAGAAQAALDKRKQDAQNAIEDQKKFYETARQTELKSVTENVNGLLLTREQIEQRILTNTNKITRNKATELETLIRIGEQAEKIYGTSKSNPTVKKASGGMIMPQRFAVGGGVFGTDTVPAMLTPGEFVVRKSAVDAIGTSKLNAINNGDLATDSVYNYTIQINVKSDSNANEIADTVLRQIERLDSQRLRGVKI